MSKSAGSSFVFTPSGVKIKGKPTFEEWWQQVQQYARAAQGVQWWLGDLLAYGQDSYGEQYDQVVAETGLEYQTIQNYKWVSGAVPPETRREELSWQHHVSVAKLKPAQQERWLNKAVKDKLSAADLKKAVRSAAKRKDAKDLAEDHDVREGRYRVLLADPDWRELGLETLESMKLPADGKSVLFLWAPADRLRDAIVLVDRWGFAFQTCAVWDRCKSSGEFWFRVQHEVLLVATRGEMRSPAAELLAPSVHRAKPGKGDAKPDEFYRIIEDMIPVKGKSKRIIRVDLFGLSEREGWDVGYFGAPAVMAEADEGHAEATERDAKAAA